ncbi:MAG: TPM domain-containing protein [Flavobacteriaceae bacterium]|nr:TPM domain-containing protein [Flavobacteriaceae bacterium]
MSRVEDFLTSKEEQRIIKAIQEAEKNTSGEIRVHIEDTTDKKVMDRALEVFYSLQMDKTKLHNGILLYIAVKSKLFAILGDKGIHEKVPKNYWNEENEMVLSYFKEEKYTEGLCKVIKSIGEKLKIYFPYQSDDTNELSDEISKGTI